MSDKITLRLEVDSTEAEILIAALADVANRRDDLAETLDRLRHEIEEQVG